MKSGIKTKGTVFLKIENKDGSFEERVIPNTVLKAGRVALAKGLTNQIGESFDFFIVRMLFGDGGIESGQKKFVNSNRQSLFGLTRLSKPVISSIEPSNTTQAIFTSVVGFEEANSTSLSEMALQMNNGELFSMATFSPITKTSQIQILFNWNLNLL
jgi:hypothetical protein